jgi:hypothetical protein
MQNLIAYSVTILVAFVILMIIMTVNLRVQQTAIATTQYQASKISQADLVEMMDRDFRNIGSSYPNYALDPTTAIIAFDSTGVFSFWAQTERGMPPATVQYDWAESGTVRLDSGYVPAYSISRTVDGNPAGGSSGSVTNFGLRLLDSNGNPVAVLSDTRQIDVDLSIVSSLGSSSLVETNDWRTVIRPAALAQDTL